MTVVRKQILVTVDYDTEAWRAFYGDDHADDAASAADIDVDWQARRAAPQTLASIAAQPYALLRTDPSVRPLDGADEAGFRRAVPRTVDGLTVVAVHGFTPAGDNRPYPQAVALTHTPEADQPWATHLIAWRADRPDHEWIAWAAQPVDTEDVARKALTERPAHNDETGPEHR